jgi:hypothetical protein
MQIAQFSLIARTTKMVDNEIIDSKLIDLSVLQPDNRFMPSLLYLAFYRPIFAFQQILIAPGVFASFLGFYGL